MRLMFVGDISLGEYYFSFGHGPRTVLKEDGIFNSVFPLLTQADFTIGNLEGPISDIDYDQGSPESKVLRGSPSSSIALKKAGFNLLSVANNHSVQHGERCFEDSVLLLKYEGLDVIGLNNQAPKIIKSNGVSVALLACSDIADNTNQRQTQYAKYNFENIVKRVNEVKDSVDWFVLYLHWGNESEVKATEEQKLLAKKLHNAGIDIIVGHHPHIFYEIEQNKNTLTAYSLGNFVFDLSWDKALLNSGILEINLTKDKIESKVHKLQINKKHQPELLNENAINIKNGLNIIYKNRKSLVPTQLKKLGYFLSFLLRGETKIKLSFLYNKIKEKKVKYLNSLFQKLM